MLRSFRPSLVALFLASVLSLSSAAFAHDLYIVPAQFRTAPGQSVTIGFHSGDGFPESTQNPARLQDATARTKGGEDSKAARERYTKYAKSIFLAGAPNDGYKKVVGLPIEIVPEKDPYALKPGETLPVIVLVRGAPAAGLEIRTASSVPGSKIISSGKTGRDGRISIPVTAGQYRLHALHMERVSDGSADWESLWATLTFEVR